MHCFLQGMSANPEELVFTAPFTDDDFSTANGAGSLRIDSKVTALFPFRNELIIFGEERIYRLTGNTIADFVLQPITRDIGCLNGFTVQELAGDIVFLGEMDSEPLRVPKELMTLNWELYQAMSKNCLMILT